MYILKETKGNYDIENNPLYADKEAAKDLIMSPELTPPISRANPHT